MKTKAPGIIAIVIALGLIATGIFVKRQLDMPQYLIIFHILGGLLLVTGISLLFLGRQSKE
ncbi:MAG: hypothetical protein HY819_12170 [Acidobacteria bacterium]|nr:hypothetical protein [Acidobacteriota bacterium]